MVATQFNKELHPELYRRLLRKHGLKAWVPKKKLFIGKKNKVLRSKYVSRVQYFSPMNVNLIFLVVMAIKLYRGQKKST